MVKHCRLFNFSESFSDNTGDSHVYSRCVIKVVEGFSVIGNLAVVTCITVNYARVIFFLK